MNKQIIKDMIVLTNAIARVRELHSSSYSEKFNLTYCNYDAESYPCSTIIALDGEQ